MTTLHVQQDTLLQAVGAEGLRRHHVEIHTEGGVRHLAHL